MPTVKSIPVRGLDPAPRDWNTDGAVAEQDRWRSLSLAKRVFLPVNSTSPAGIVDASKRDPWRDSGQYALGWTYFCVTLIILTAAARYFDVWRDKIRTAMYKDDMAAAASSSSSPNSDYEMKSVATSNSVARLFPPPGKLPKPPKTESTLSTIRPLNQAIAAGRWLVYRPIPTLRWRKRTILFPSLSALFIGLCALVFATLYCFIPQPLYYPSIRFGSPPVAIRAGMLAVAMVPWIVALSMKANLVSLVTGIGHERLCKFHRWGGYLVLLLSLIHAIPFYLQPAREEGAMAVFKSYFPSGSGVYTTGIACLIPLLWLCIASLPFLRSWMYELFVSLHVPVSIIFVGLLFWHCRNYLMSWNYLWATVAIWLSSYLARLFMLNWSNPRRMSWLIGDEASVRILPEGAIRVTIPTQVRWKPGQFVYLRIPAISIFENHPFTIASLCSDDFPSEYGEEYKDMALVFKPFGGFTRKMLNIALEKGPLHTYRAFLDGPYGGMQRSLDSFDNVVLIAGGSGITALVSHVLDLVKRMRDGKAVTKKVQVVWAVKRLEAIEWFKEELRICREYAPPESVECQFYVTAAKRQTADPLGLLSSATSPRPQRPISRLFGSEKINEFAQGIASKRNSALIRAEAGGDAQRERELRRENEDDIVSLPSPTRLVRAPKPVHTRQKLSLDVSNINDSAQANNFDFGFPSTPTLFQKNLMRFAFGGPRLKRRDGWSVEYGRPDLPYMLKDFATDFGKRSCIFVCGPEGMRNDVARAVARLQTHVLENPLRDEIHLHYEDFAL